LSTGLRDILSLTMGLARWPLVATETGAGAVPEERVRTANTVTLSVSRTGRTLSVGRTGRTGSVQTRQ